MYLLCQKKKPVHRSHTVMMENEAATLSLSLGGGMLATLCLARCNPMYYRHEGKSITYS